jgi:hypothetical protein
VLTSLNFIISAHCNEFSQNRWFFAISPNSGGFAYFPHKCGGFFGINSFVTQCQKLKPPSVKKSTIGLGPAIVISSSSSYRPWIPLSPPHFSMEISPKIAGQLIYSLPELRAWSHLLYSNTAGSLHLACQEAPGPVIDLYAGMLDLAAYALVVQLDFVKCLIIEQRQIRVSVHTSLSNRLWCMSLWPAMSSAHDC